MEDIRNAGSATWGEATPYGLSRDIPSRKSSLASLRLGSPSSPSVASLSTSRPASITSRKSSTASRASRASLDYTLVDYATGKGLNELLKLSNNSDPATEEFIQKFNEFCRKNIKKDADGKFLMKNDSNDEYLNLLDIHNNVIEFINARNKLAELGFQQIRDELKNTKNKDNLIEIINKDTKELNEITLVISSLYTLIQKKKDEASYAKTTTGAILSTIRKRTAEKIEFDNIVEDIYDNLLFKNDKNIEDYIELLTKYKRLIFLLSNITGQRKIIILNTMQQLTQTPEEIAKSKKSRIAQFEALFAKWPDLTKNTKLMEEFIIFRDGALKQDTIDLYNKFQTEAQKLKKQEYKEILSFLRLNPFIYDILDDSDKKIFDKEEEKAKNDNPDENLSAFWDIIKKGFKQLTARRSKEIIDIINKENLIELLNDTNFTVLINTFKADNPENGKIHNNLLNIINKNVKLIIKLHSHPDSIDEREKIMEIMTEHEELYEDNNVKKLINEYNKKWNNTSLIDIKKNIGNTCHGQLLNLQYTINGNLLSEFSNKSRIFYKLCKNNLQGKSDCNYILKIIQLTKKNNDYIKILEKIHDNDPNITTEFINNFKCKMHANKKYEFINLCVKKDGITGKECEKLIKSGGDELLYVLFTEWQFINNNDVKLFNDDDFTSIIKLIMRLHKLGIVHDGIDIKSMGKNKNNKLILINFENSLFSTKKDDRINDFKTIENIIDLYDKGGVQSGGGKSLPYKNTKFPNTRNLLIRLSNDLNTAKFGQYTLTQPQVAMLPISMHKMPDPEYSDESDEDIPIIEPVIVRSSSPVKPLPPLPTPTNPDPIIPIVYNNPKTLVSNVKQLEKLFKSNIVEKCRKINKSCFATAGSDKQIFNELCNIQFNEFRMKYRDDVKGKIDEISSKLDDFIALEPKRKQLLLNKIEDEKLRNESKDMDCDAITLLLEAQRRQKQSKKFGRQSGGTSSRSDRTSSRSDRTSSRSDRTSSRSDRTSSRSDRTSSRSNIETYYY